MRNQPLLEDKQDQLVESPRDREAYRDIFAKHDLDEKYIEPCLALLVRARKVMPQLQERLPGLITYHVVSTSERSTPIALKDFCKQKAEILLHAVLVEDGATTYPGQTP